MRNTKIGLVLTFTLLSLSSIKAGELYWVFFTDKNGSTIDPYAFFDERTIERRVKLGIPLVEYSDLPVSDEYKFAIGKHARVRSESRWLNAITIDAGPSQIRSISELPFVAEVQKLTMVSKKSSSLKESFNIDLKTAEHLQKQVNAFGGELFIRNGIDGKGVRIAVFDGGFPGVDTLEVFSHIRKENRIIATWDFVKDREFVYDYNSHGTSVLSCIAGILDGKNYGLGSGAEFLLARTEVNREVFSEEENWARAMEWAEKNGADIISSSLGYTWHRYFPNQMDGKSTYITRIANTAASKGLLVINAAGNEGSEKWQVIGAPADADSILSVGGIASNTGIHSDFSSFGPTFDGRLKPNVVAFSDVIVAGKKKNYKLSYGTSFATPLVSGFAACVMQMHPDWDNMKVLKEIEKSGHLYPYYDYAHGYGVPQASGFLGSKEDIGPTFSFTAEDDQIVIKLIPVTVDSLTEDNSEEGWNEDSVVEISQNPERFTMDDAYLYYHISSAKTGKIRKYAVVDMQGQTEFRIDPFFYIREGEKLVAFHRGYTGVWTSEEMESANLPIEYLDEEDDE